MHCIHDTESAVINHDDVPTHGNSFIRTMYMGKHLETRKNTCKYQMAFPATYTNCYYITSSSAATWTFSFVLKNNNLVSHSNILGIFHSATRDKNCGSIWLRPLPTIKQCAVLHIHLIVLWYTSRHTSKRQELRNSLMNRTKGFFWLAFSYSNIVHMSERRHFYYTFMFIQ